MSRFNESNGISLVNIFYEMKVAQIYSLYQSYCQKFWHFTKKALTNKLVRAFLVYVIETYLTKQGTI